MYFFVQDLIVLGIICYVDVRSEKEDMTLSVQAELLTLGAKVEKNFTKKVILFKCIFKFNNNFLNIC